MNKYRVPATMYTFLSTDVLAESADEAFAIARKRDGGDFIEVGLGDWRVGEPNLIEENIEEEEA